MGRSTRSRAQAEVSICNRVSPGARHGEQIAGGPAHPKRCMTGNREGARSGGIHRVDGLRALRRQHDLGSAFPPDPQRNPARVAWTLCRVCRRGRGRAGGAPVAASCHRRTAVGRRIRPLPQRALRGGRRQVDCGRRPVGGPRRLERLPLRPRCLRACSQPLCAAAFSRERGACARNCPSRSQLRHLRWPL